MQDNNQDNQLEAQDANTNPSELMTSTEFGKVMSTSIVKEMEKAYLDYAMSVIVSRALPDVRDGLKPVHRRVLFAMKNMGLTSKSAYKKSARIVGEVLGKYHPHGDQSVYQTLVRLAQDFNMRYPLVDGQGNFGSIDGDGAAAMRYTEARLAKISDELLVDIDKDTVDFVDNFDGSEQEPSVLPARLPNLLLMGGDGIAVGMATKIPPHNLTELVKAIKELVSKSETKPSTHEIDKNNIENIKPELIAGGFISNATIDDLLKHIKGPDFPTGANIYNPEDIRQAYITGKGRVLIRAKAEITEVKNKHRIEISEIPYQVNKSKLIIKIANLVKDKKVIGISDIRDESDRKGMHIVIELKKGSRPQSILNNLYKYTDLQTTFSMNMVALVNGTPQLCNLKLILSEYVKHRQLVVVRRSQNELKAAKLRAHILEGLKIAVDNIDEIIKTIRSSKDTESAKNNLMTKFNLSKIQAEAILDMQLRKLSGLERQKLEEEYQSLLKRIDVLIELLINPEKILNLVVNELEESVGVYGDKRRTKVHGNLTNLSEEDLVPNTPVVISVTKSGYVKRVPKGTYKIQRRGGKGVTSMNTKAEDEISFLITAHNHDDVLFFTNKGKVHHIKAYDIPEGSRIAKGIAVINLINIDSSEKIKSVIAISNISKSKGFLIMATKKGLIKKSELNKYAKIKSNGLQSIKLDPNDQLITVKTTSGEDQVFMVTYRGKAIRFNEKDVRPMGRATKGVKGINIKPDDYLVTMETFPTKEKRADDKRIAYFRDLLVATEKGIGKRTPVDQFPLHHRAGTGVKIAKLTERTGFVASAAVVTREIEQIMLTTKKAQMIKLPLKNIKQLGRNTQGIILMRFSKKDDVISAMTCIAKEEEK